MSQNQPSNPFSKQDLTQVALRKTKKVKDTSAPVLTGYLTKEEIEEYDKYLKSFDIESWYDKLKEYTFPTYFIPLTVEDATVMHQACIAIENWSKQKYLNEISDNKKDNITKSNEDDVVKTYFEKLSSVTQQIDDILNKIKDKQKNNNNDNKEDNDNKNVEEKFGVFAKLSSRSAKDATDAENRLQDLFKKYCEMNKDHIENENDLLVQLMTASTHCMKVNNSNSILQMFMHSDRIKNDIGRALENPKNYYQNIIIREWVPIDIDMEFRGFVCNGKLNALSQYDYFIFFKRLVQMKNNIAQQILKFWESKIKNILNEHYESYVIDFAIYNITKDVDNNEKYDILIIELNPFMESTDGALFSWKKERKILENGPFEFRIADQLPLTRPPIESKYRKILGWEN